MYDIIVIGAGSGGLNIAGFMNRVGFKTLLIDKSDKSIGGDCLNFGCVPSKALIHIARQASSAKKIQGLGLKIGGHIDLKKVMQYVDDKKEYIRKHENADYFRKKGMNVELGDARFVSHNKISVNGKTFFGKKIVIATGSRPRKLRIPGIEKVKFHTNETIFDMENLPDHLVVIGGGPIGIELGQAFLHLGSRVSVILKDDIFLPKESKEIRDVLYKRLVDEGMKFYFNTSPKMFIDSNTLITEQNGKKLGFKFDEVLISIGRSLNIENLDLEKAGIDITSDGERIIVDDYLQTTNKDVFLCGDIAGGYQFTHAAELHASLILSNFFKPKLFRKKLSYDNLSWVTYTTPEIATFGLNETQLKERKISYDKLVHDLTDDDRAIVDDVTYGKLVLFVKKGKVLGGSMVAENAGEISQELMLANSAGINVKHIFNKIYPYPTASRVNKKIITDSFAKKLTPSAIKILKWSY